MDTFDPESPFTKPLRAAEGLSGERVWAVGPLMRALADTLAARFNPVAVQGEISGFSRAASGHCYFALKDEAGQVRCALFRRVADQLGGLPKDGQRVVLRGRLDVYGPRGELQLIVEALQPAGQGALFERFLLLKAELEAEGLFDPARKRPLPAQPRHIGVITSLGAAALRDVAIALRRRAPHVVVTVFPSAVQGAGAPGELAQALRTANAYRGERGPCDVLLLVRGGGSLEDLWAFNEGVVVRAVASSHAPVVVGVGHETDFSLADFAADLRAPTPTAAAELCAADRAQRLGELAYLAERLRSSLGSGLDQKAQRLDRIAAHMGRPSHRLNEAAQRLIHRQQRLRSGLELTVQRQRLQLQALGDRLPSAAARTLEQHHRRVERCDAALSLLDPAVVLRRGYAYLTDSAGHALTRAVDAVPGQSLEATLADGQLHLQVLGPSAST